MTNVDSSRSIGMINTKISKIDDRTSNRAKIYFFLIICNSIYVSMLLIVVEVLALYIVKDLLKPNIIGCKMNICNFISFLNDDDCGKVVFHTWKIVLCRTIKNIFTAAAIIVIYLIVCIEAELMSSDNYFKTLTERFRAIRTRSFEVLMWSWTVEVYTTSWGSNIPMIGPLWILFAYLLNRDYHILKQNCIYA